MTPSLSLMVIQLTVQLAWIWIDRLKSLVWRFSRKKKELCQRMRLQNFISNMKDLNTLINWLNLWLGIVNTKAQFRYFLSSTAAVKDLKWSWSFFFLNKAKIYCIQWHTKHLDRLRGIQFSSTLKSLLIFAISTRPVCLWGINTPIICHMFSFNCF